MLKEVPRVSIVVPGLNEAQSLGELATRIDAAIGGKVPYELIFVDDGSTDETWQVIRDLHVANPAVKGVRLRKNFGKATALSAGFKRVLGEIIVMMDADLQDDPADLPRFIEKIEDGYDVVVGWKVERLDPANRKVLSRIFNGTVRRTTGVKLHDMNCGFKAYRLDVIKAVPIYGDLFRFIPALAAWQGFRVTEIPIKHHARAFGQSRYGLERILRGIFDLMTVLFLTKYSKKPMHLFGLVGLVFTMTGFGINTYLTVLWTLGHKIGDRPLLLLGVLMIILGIQFFSMGFLAEFMTFQMQKKADTDALPDSGGDPVIPDHYFDRFQTQKYRVKNPVQRALIRRFVHRLHNLFIEANPIESVLEIGVGEGFLSGYLSEKFPEKRFTGIDLSAADLARLREKFPRIQAHEGSAYELAFIEPGKHDLIVCCEVLEHLDDPEKAIDEMHRLAPRRLLLSVPHEPFFRLSNLLRGKNVSRLGNDIEHVNQFSPTSFRRLIERRFDVLQATTSYPWILALAAPR